MSKEYIKIDPVHELLEAIAIVHGEAYANRLSYIIARIKEQADKNLNTLPWSRERLQFVLDNEVVYDPLGSTGWHFIVDEREVHFTSFPDAPERIIADFRLRAEWKGADAATGRLETQQSRWWPLSAHMCKTEVIQTAFLCIMKAEEHELRETFKYKGRAIFNTHIDVNTLWEMAEDVDVRTDTRPREAGTPEPKQRRE